MESKAESKPTCEALEKRVAELEQENKVLKERAVRDGKTGLYSPQFYNSNINIILQESVQKRQDIGMIFLDMNKLKYLNDNFGHNNGDRVIRDLARIIESSVKSSDHVIRWGGDEIVILLSNAKGGTGKSVINRINTKIAKYNEHNRLEGKDKEGNPISYELSVSTGYVLRSYKSKESMDDIIQKADNEMYEHKKRSKDKKINDLTRAAL
jgi:two-component system cell cycle response regulator